MKKKRKTRKTARRKAAKRSTRKAARRKTAKRATRKKARRKVAKRATRKKARKKTAKRPTRKAARKRVVKRATKKTARKKAAKRKAAPKKSAKPKAAPKKTAKAAKPSAKAPAPIALVAKRKTASRAPAARADDRTVKESALFELMRARAVVLAVIEGLDASSAEQPLAEGKWSAREVVLHLAARDRARLREMESILRGSPASWWAYDDDEQARDNAEAIAATNHMRWEEAVDYLLSTRRELLESLESVPEGPAEVWTPEHTFGRMVHGLPNHDRHHAEAIQRWRDEQGV
jgi:uncharacterized damage-inducible protein DinB